MKDVVVYDVIGRVLEANGVEWKEGMTLGHITYDKSVNDDYDYKIIRSKSHDGTLLFTHMLLEESVIPLINRTTYYKPAVPEGKQVKGVHYTIGDGVMTSEYEKVKIAGRMQSGVTDTFEIPVKFSVKEGIT